MSAYWDQTEHWTDRAGNLSKLEELPAGHRRNILRMVRERIDHIRRQKEMRLVGIALGMEGGGEMARDTFEAVSRELEDWTDDELFESLPLVKRLREIAAHDPDYLNGIPVTVHEPDALFFREAWVSGKFEGREFAMDRTVSGAGIVLDIDAGNGQPRRVESIQIQDLVKVWLERPTTT